MDVMCLSLPNPLSYLLCAGIKDVDNRGFDTDYRGRVYIHSAGRYSLRGMPDMSEFPVPVIHEFNDKLTQIQELDESGDFIGFADEGVRVLLKDEGHQPQWAVNQYALLSDAYHSYRKNPRDPFFHAKAIIGTADLVDVMRDSPSLWAEEGYNHWLFARPVLFKEPYRNIRTTRTGLWTVSLPDGERT